MRKVYINSYYIDPKKYNKELDDIRELEKEMYPILKLELEQGLITEEEFEYKVSNLYSSYDDTRIKIIPDSNGNFNSNVIAGYKKNQLFVPYDGVNVDEFDQKIFVSNAQINALEEKIRYYLATNDDSLLKMYPESIQEIIFDFIDVCCDPCELEQFLKEYGVSILRKKKVR